jgi:hypothetical protein
MESNSVIFTESVFGLSSGNTAIQITEKNTVTQEQYLNQTTESRMNYRIPVVPSNQAIAKDT